MQYHVKDRNEHWRADGTPKRILSLDGGGVRGALTLEYLDFLESLLRERHGSSDEFRLCHYFDLIAGTSTGAIIAAALAKGMSVGEIKELYRSFASTVFKKFYWRRGFLFAKYDSSYLKKYLKSIFANNTMGSSSIKTGLLIVAKRLDTGSVWPMSNNPGNRFFVAGKGDQFLSNEDYPLESVIRASTAAPTYFVPEEIEISQSGDRPHGEFVDGGMSPHNNPALLALQLATLKGFGAGWALDPDKLLLVSVGTGAAPTGTSKSWFAVGHAKKALLSLMDDCAESVEVILQWLSSSKTARKIDASVQDLSSDLVADRPLIEYVRYNVQLESGWLKSNLNYEISELSAGKLCEIDVPENMEELSVIGKRAANLQIKKTHFPSNFDLGL